METAPRAYAVRRSGPIRMDGTPDEDAWAEAPPVDELTQYQPDEGMPMTQRTDARFLYDDDALYVGALSTAAGIVLYELFFPYRHRRPTGE